MSLNASSIHLNEDILEYNQKIRQSTGNLAILLFLRSKFYDLCAQFKTYQRLSLLLKNNIIQNNDLKRLLRKKILKFCNNFTVLIGQSVAPSIRLCRNNNQEKIFSNKITKIGSKIGSLKLFLFQARQRWRMSTNPTLTPSGLTCQYSRDSSTFSSRSPATSSSSFIPSFIPAFSQTRPLRAVIRAWSLGFAKSGEFR